MTPRSAMSAGSASDDSEGVDSLEAELRSALSPSHSVGTPGVGESEFAREGFDVQSKIAKGGMGTVYRGRHRETGHPVAIKLLQEIEDPETLDDFRHEVRAHAKLQHPGIVYLFEYGDLEVPGRGPAGEATAEHPYVVMELADGGTIRELLPFDDWGACRRVLTHVLDALAYAHARGVIHRDLKPGNLLLFDRRGSGERRRVKLTDFGVAHTFEHEPARSPEELARSIGTPHYMAPEQIRGQWRRYGPWTDLYALGCLTWRMVCGRRPFTAGSPLELLEEHLTAERPAVDPRFPVPEGLDRWIRRAMAIRPERRFRRAADAFEALPSGETRSDREGPSAERTGGSRDVATVAATLASTRVDAAAGPPDELLQREREAGERADEPAPRSESDGSGAAHSVPEDWRRAGTDRIPAPLVGAGLGLFGLRDPPFVGREREREAIWRALREVGEGDCRFVFLTGRAGSGKSRLVQWVARRAHELGAATVLRAIHSRSGGGATEGLSGMVERALHTWNLPRDDVYEHLCETLPPLPGSHDLREPDARALTELVRPTPEGATEVAGPPFQFSNVHQKRALLERLLRRFAARRPLIWWIDDLQWGPEALGLLEFLRERSDEPPDMLMVATLRSEILADAPTLGERIGAMEAGERSRSLSVEPLDETHQLEMLEGLLPLEEDLAEELGARTEGRPLFAMQLLGHWIQRGLIEIGSDGFRVPEGAEVEVPDDIHELWMGRIDRLLEGFPPEERPTILEGLELAAALGREVATGEWRAALKRAELPVPRELVDRLVERGLADTTADGWSFAHGLLVDSLARRARRAGRWRAHHRNCAEMLRDTHSDRPETTAARRAEHWREAGEFERVLEPLEEEFHRLRQVGDLNERRAVLTRREQLVETLELPESDPRRLEVELDRAAMRLEVEGTLEEVIVSLEEAGSRAEDAGNHRLSAKAHVKLAYAHGRDKAYADSRTHGERAVRAARTSADEKILVEALSASGLSAFWSGDLKRADQDFSEASRRSARMDRTYLRVGALDGLGWVALVEGDERRAAELFEEALELSREGGFRAKEARCLNGLGDLARFRGDVGRARDRYREFRERSRILGRPWSVALSTAALAQVELMAENFAEADELIRETERRWRELSVDAETADLLRLARLAHSSGTGDWEQFDRIASHYTDGWPEDSAVEKDRAWLLEMAGDYAAEAGRTDRAADVWEVAGELWEKLGDDGAVRRVAGKRPP